MSSFAAKLQAAAAAESWHLAFDKFPCNLASQDLPAFSTQPDQKGRTKGILAQRLRKVLSAYQGALPELEDALSARRAFLPSLAKQHGPRLRRIVLVNSSRLLLQLGRPSALGTASLSLDRTTGLPLVPGSAVKGAVSAWACWEDNETRLFPPGAENARLETQRASSPSRARQILGDNSPSGSNQAGSICFLGAWPKTVPALALDLVTPHSDPAGRSQDPEPSPFLAIEQGTAWDFVLLVRAGLDDSEATVLLDTAERWLLDALDQAGLGARTSTGYGRFLLPARWTVTGAKAAPSQAVRQAEASAGPLPPSDFPNETIFANRILKKLNPGAIDQIQAEIEKLKRRENAAWRAQLVEALRGREMREVRKKLRDKPWFPQDWLPPQ